MQRMLMLSLLLTSSQLVHAAGIPSEGPIDSMFTWTTRQQTMPTADGMEAFTAEAFLVLTAESPGSILDRLAARCLMTGKQSPTGSDYSSTGTCTFIDAAGDQIFETFEETAAGGSGKLVGGTGKFAGISGEHTITEEVFGSPAEGVWQGIGHKKGTYKITK
jgi:hypothetical protein